MLYKGMGFIPALSFRVTDVASASIMSLLLAASVALLRPLYPWSPGFSAGEPLRSPLVPGGTGKQPDLTTV